MRRYLFCLLSVLALAVAIPAIAAGHSGDRQPDRHDHARDRAELRHHRRHDRVEHFRAHAKLGMAADVGTVKSLTGGVLTITLNDGTTVHGLVKPSTEIECEAMDHDFTRDDGGPG